MLDRTSYLANRIFVAYDCDLNAYYQDAKDKSLESAKKIFKKIKEFDRKVDNIIELKHAKDDLENIFEVNTKGMTKNKIFLEHQSKMINSIYSEILLDESYF